MYVAYDFFVKLSLMKYHLCAVEQSRKCLVQGDYKT